MPSSSSNTNTWNNNLEQTLDDVVIPFPSMNAKPSTNNVNNSSDEDDNSGHITEATQMSIATHLTPPPLEKSRNDRYTQNSNYV
eukprot:7777102-Ditylum_brightwellii.AAC.2